MNEIPTLVSAGRHNIATRKLLLGLVKEEGNQDITSAHQRIEAVNPKNKEAGIIVILQSRNNHYSLDHLTTASVLCFSKDKTRPSRNTLSR